MASSTLRPITQAVLGDGDGIPFHHDRGSLNPEAPAVGREGKRDIKESPATEARSIYIWAANGRAARRLLTGLPIGRAPSGSEAIMDVRWHRRGRERSPRTGDGNDAPQHESEQRQWARKAALLPFQRRQFVRWCEDWEVHGAPVGSIRRRPALTDRCRHRTVLANGSDTRTGMASGLSLITSVKPEGGGMGSPSSAMPSTCRASACRARLTASSRLGAAVTAPLRAQHQRRLPPPG
jgi:hypothetical protein